MSWEFPLLNGIDLHVEERISAEDAERQSRTAGAVLDRLAGQPGIILADEVGMGKTFVALAAAASVALVEGSRNQVVVMVPSNLKDKWPRDFDVFRKMCLPAALRSRFECAVAERSVEFLKLLDDPPERRKSVVFLTHGAMSRGLTDHWVQLALVWRALYNRKDDGLRRAAYRFAGRLTQLHRFDGRFPDLWEKLLKRHPGEWRDYLISVGVAEDLVEEGYPAESFDDPVPESVWRALEDMDVQELFETLQQWMPRRESAKFQENMKQARRAILEHLRGIWGTVLRKLTIRLPLLILDEAHHLKNAHTRIASLFQAEDAEADANEVSKGPLAGMFQRMLFLTATPFQLGHGELCSVLERFEGIDWDGDGNQREVYKSSVSNLRKALDRAQESALRLDRAWGELAPADLVVGGKKHADIPEWWSHARHSPDQATEPVRAVLSRFEDVRSKMESAEELLRPWVVRHVKPERLPDGITNRRRRFSGAGIREESIGDSGLEVGGESLLPFLLAARAVALTPESRPVFAEGLASSYEAFLHTRKEREKDEKGQKSEDFLDQDDIAKDGNGDLNASRWYLDHISKALPLDSEGVSVRHPKMAATVDRAIRLWLAGEKVVVFCHYVATGRALRRAISEAMRGEIRRMGAEKLRCVEPKVDDELERLGARFFDEDSPIRRATDEKVSSLLKDYPGLAEHRDRLLDIVRRNLRTPTFLVRFFPLDRSRMDVRDIETALQSRDASKLTLEAILDEYFHFLQKRCGDRERLNYIEASHAIQPGSYRVADLRKTLGEDEFQHEKPENILPNVRLVNGQVGHETKNRLMLTFNTPFLPEVLISSNVLAEGVDLHINCRFMIHHDLCWNPSTLEQRTGRVDRIGAKNERCKAPAHIYLPYVAETQDQKMYQVVMDRERWFRVVMGSDYELDLRTTDKLAERIPFPETAANELAFDLGVK